MMNVQFLLRNPALGTARKGAQPATRNRAAFTLIELLLVLVILGVLAVLVVPRFAGTAERGRRQAALTQIENFKTTLATFEIDCGRFPTTDEGLQALVVQPSGAKGWQRKYIESIPDDPWGNPYVYRCPGTHDNNDYDLFSTADGTDTAGDSLNSWKPKK